MSNFEDEYLDVLQNIEFAIVTVYRQNRDLSDYDVDKVLNALIRAYQSQQQNRDFPQPTLKPLVEQVYDRVKQICEWRLGQQKLKGNGPRSKGPAPDPISIDEVIACLKRIRKSVEIWNKQGGTRGYLQYIDQFIA